MTLEDRPSRRYRRSWITQRIANQFAPWTHARSCPVSVAQQIINVGALEIQKTEQQLAEEARNMHLSDCNPLLMDHAYSSELPAGFSFGETETVDGAIVYAPPTVCAEINDVLTEIAIAEDNNIETFYYDCLPTRIVYGEVQKIWDDVISETTASEISSVEPEELVLEGHLYVTLMSNTIWKTRFKDTYYFTKITIIGYSRKGTYITETLPLRYNGTFKTINQWSSVEEVFVSHVDGNAKVVISCLPFSEDPIVDQWNTAVPIDGGDRIQFLGLEENDYGSILVGRSFLNADMELIRMGLDDTRRDYAIELLDQDSLNITAEAFLCKPYSDLIYLIDANSLYVYDRNVPYPELENTADQSADVRMALTTDDSQWIYSRGETATVTTRILDVGNIPICYRFLLYTPSGSKYYIGLDGSLWPITEADGWITSPETSWDEQRIEISMSELGAYTLEIETKYKELDDTHITRKAKLILFVPSVLPEAQFVLPDELKGCRDIKIDSDGDLWFYNGTSVMKAILYHDYFIADYAKKVIWTREDYPRITVEP
jgi:hypothetical protein